MPLIYFVVIPSTSQVFGAQTDSGHVPAFFTDRDKAIEFFTDKDAQGLLACSDRLSDFRGSLEHNKTTYVLVDMKLMTVKEFIDNFSTNQ